MWIYQNEIYILLQYVANTWCFPILRCCTQFLLMKNSTNFVWPYDQMKCPVTVNFSRQFIWPFIKCLIISCPMPMFGIICIYKYISASITSNIRWWSSTWNVYLLTTINVEPVVKLYRSINVIRLPRAILLFSYSHQNKTRRKKTE